MDSSLEVISMRKEEVEKLSPQVSLWKVAHSEFGDVHKERVLEMDVLWGPVARILAPDYVQQ